MTTGPKDPLAGGDRFRAGYADREQVIEVLKTAFVDGRLTKNELTARTGGALAARTYADLAALTVDIPAEPAAAEPVPAEPAPGPAGPARSPGPPMRRPLAKAAAGSGVGLVIAAGAIHIGGFHPGGPGPNPHHSWTLAFLLLTFVAVMTGLSILRLGVASSREQRRSRGQLPPPPRAGGRVSGSGRGVMPVTPPA